MTGLNLGPRPLKGWVMVGIGVLAFFIVTLIFGLLCELPFQTCSDSRQTEQMFKRATNKGKTDWCMDRIEGVELNYFCGATTTFSFDLCLVVNCGNGGTGWEGYAIYLCMDKGWSNYCKRRRDSWPRPPPCGSWSRVTTWTGSGWTPDKKAVPGNLTNISIQRGTPGGAITNGRNPLMLSIYINCTQSSVEYFTLAVWQSGTDTWGPIRINFRTPSVHQGNTITVPPTVRPQNKPQVMELDYSQLKPMEVIQMATGYTEDNLWLQWITQTAKEQSKAECVACASARPHLTTDPAPLYPEDTWGYNCMIQLTKEATPANCTTLASIFPPIPNNTKTGPFTPQKGNGSYTCFNFTVRNPKINVGQIPLDWCNRTTSGGGIGSWARAGLYYYCGDHRLLTSIPQKTVGLCAMVRLQAPLVLIGPNLTSVTTTHDKNRALTRRRRRHAMKRSTGTFDLSQGSPTYIDAIGVPRGVPNEFKIADQISAGFENVPIIAALFPVTPNKNVDRINYIHYNVLRLANLTRDAVEGLSEQLAPTSLMAVQNRMALDMLLAEKGGVCVMFGDMCCTFIPNNTAPDGSVSKALEGLKTLSATMHEHSGINSPLEDWMTGMFGHWKGLIMSLFISIAVFVAIMVTCGCCCVPCIRSLIVRFITTTIEGKTAPPPPSHMMPLLAVDANEEEDGE